MASCDVFLPTCALNVRRHSEPIVAIVDGCSAVSDAAEIACDAAGKEASIIYQSPLAAYFDEFNSFNSLSKFAPSAAQFISNLLPLACNFIAESEQEITMKTPDDRTPSSGKIHDECNFNTMTCAIAFDGLPCKSPSSAYFDGADTFGLGGHVKCNDVVSLLPATRLSVIAEISDCVSDSTDRDNTIAGMTSFTNAGYDTAETMYTSVRKENACGTIQSIRWADEGDDRKTLHLSDLIDPSQVYLPMKHSVWELSRDAKGCREVQRMLSECRCAEAGLAIAGQLRGHVLDAVRCPHANHVVHKIIETLPPIHCNFILEEIVQQGQLGVKEVATHRYGCRIMEELLRVCHEEQLTELIDFLLFDAEALCTHMYGNFVMKSLLQNSSPVRCQRLVKVLMNNVTIFGTNFYACAVLAEVFQSSRVEACVLAHMILSVSGLLSAIVKHKHGRKVLESMMTLLEDDQRRVLVKELTLAPLKVAKGTKTSKK